jgi:hypothetical protein
LALERRDGVPPSAYLLWGSIDDEGGEAFAD